VKHRATAARLLFVASTLLPSAASAQVPAAAGPAIQRSANLASGAPAFDVIDARGRRASRIECIWSGWYDADTLANKLLGSTAVMAAIIAKGGRIALEDLGPARFDCTVKNAAP
jgi:hypothetical protein